MNLTASIVLFKNEREVLIKAISSFLSDEMPVKLYLIDNSPTDDLKDIQVSDAIEYIHNSSNIGFGAGHNIAINKAISNKSSYHFIVNPDTYFEGGAIKSMVEYMAMNPAIGMLMPEILYPDGSVQYLPKLLPSPLNILLRKFNGKLGSISGDYRKIRNAFCPTQKNL